MKRFTGLSFYWIVRAAVLVLILALPLVVFADNVQNDVVVGGNDTFTLGGSTTVNYRIAANSGDGQAGCNAADTTPATVTINVPTGVTASPNSLTFTACDVNKPVVFTATAVGDHEITVSVSDSGTGSYNVNPAKFTLHVLAPPPPADTTPPVITSSVSGTLGNNGWYVSDVTISWSVVDNESAISSSSGCGPTTINSDTAGTTLTCSATSAGGTNSQSVTIKRDATAPTINGSAAPAPNGSGWNNTNVIVSFTCSDNLSGIASCGPNQILSSDGAGQSAAGTAVDNAGNSASTTVSNISIDKTAPAVSVTGVSNDAIYTLGSVPAAGCSTTDALSGVATEATLSSSGGPVGSVTATCSGAADNAGNTGSASVTYSVIYNWSGFFSPVDNGGTFNQVKAGSAIPVKFSLAGNQGLSIFMAGYPTSVKINCSTTAPIDTIEETVTAGSSSLSYDATTDRYNYVWKTDKAWGGTCRQLTVKLIDGTTHTANFNFTK